MNFTRTVIYDGECGFCLRWVRAGRRLDWLRRLDWRARSEPGLLERFPQTSFAETKERMLSIRPDGKVYGGFSAVRDIMFHLPLTFIPALFLCIPGISWIGEPAYRWVAKNRHRFGRTACSVKK